MELIVTTFQKGRFIGSAYIDIQFYKALEFNGLAVVLAWW